MLKIVHRHVHIKRLLELKLFLSHLHCQATRLVLISDFT